MLSEVQGRKWVHESSWMVRGQKRARPEDVPDEVSTPAALATAGQRRFAPRQGRKGNFEMFQPSCYGTYGETWLKVHGEEIELLRDPMCKCDRVSLVCKNQVQLVAKAYSFMCHDQYTCSHPIREGGARVGGFSLRKRQHVVECG